MMGSTTQEQHAGPAVALGPMTLDLQRLTVKALVGLDHGAWVRRQGTIPAWSGGIATRERAFRKMFFRPHDAGKTTGPSQGRSLPFPIASARFGEIVRPPRRRTDGLCVPRSHYGGISRRTISKEDPSRQGVAPGSMGPPTPLSAGHYPSSSPFSRTGTLFFGNGINNRRAARPVPFRVLVNPWSAQRKAGRLRHFLTRTVCFGGKINKRA